LLTSFIPSRIRAALLGALACAVSVGAHAQATTPKRGGTLVFAVHVGEPSTYDCHAAASIGVMQRVSPHYSQLIKLDPQRFPQVAGDLATGWTVSPDGLAYRFTLRDKVVFHDGTPLTSNDVKVSYERMWRPPEGVVSIRKGMLEDIQAIEAPDARTIVFKLKSPNAAMLQILAMPYACVYSAKLLAEDPAYPARRVMGSGPFKFVSYTAGGDWIGVRNERYYVQDRPYLDGFRAFSTSLPASVNALVAGQAMYNFVGLTPSNIGRVKSARGNEVRIVGRNFATAVNMTIAVNTQRPPLNDVRVRRALSLALDRWSGSKAMQHMNEFNLVGGMLRPGSVYARNEQELSLLPGYGHDIEGSRKEARRLLAEAGHPNLKVNFVHNVVFAPMGVFLADQLRQIGVTLDNQAVDGPTYLARKMGGNYDLVMDVPPEYLDDPVVQWSIFKPFSANPGNFSRSNDLTFDAKYEEIKRTLDPARRRAQARDLEYYLLNQAYVLPLFWHNWTRGISEQVHGLDEVPTTLMKLDLVDLWLAPGSLSKPAPAK
jgi:peptide/nickel transport system substrate-binding protein